jgi:hypothetical protein
MRDVCCCVVCDCCVCCCLFWSTKHSHTCQHPSACCCQMGQKADLERFCAGISSLVLCCCLVSSRIRTGQAGDSVLTGLRGVVKTSRFCERRKYRCFCTAKTLKRPLRPVKRIRAKLETLWPWPHKPPSKPCSAPACVILSRT